MRGARLPSREEARRVLVEVAQRRDTISYSELGAILGLPTRGPHWKALLDDLDINRPAGTPDLSVLVVSKATRLPSTRNFQPLDSRDPATRAAIEAEQGAVWAFFTEAPAAQVRAARPRR